MPIESLPEKTRQLLLSISEIEGIEQFLLVGGTALALHAGHRVSEDLDFAFIDPGRKLLPRKTILGLITALRSRGLQAQSIDHPDAAIEFSEAALDIADYHQDFSVEGVKLTFFRHEYPALFAGSAGRTSYNRVAVASQAEIFDSKAILFGRFCRSRDVFDLWWLMSHGGFTADRMAASFARIGEPHNLQTALSRIRTQAYHATDPGYSRLDPHLPDRDQARKLLVEKIQAWLEQQAVEALQKN